MARRGLRLLLGLLFLTHGGIALEASGAPADAVVGRAYSKYQEGRRDEAMTELLLYLARHPQDPAALEALASLLKAEGDLEGALELYARAVARDPDRIELRRAYAELLREAGRLPGAAVQYRRLLQQVPEDTEAWENLAEVHLGMERPEKAAQAYEALLRRAPFRKDIRLRLAQAYAWAGQPEKGIPHLERALALDPEDRAVRERLAQQLLEAGHYRKAIGLYQALLAQERRFLYLDRLGDLYAWTHQGERARQAYREALRLEPGAERTRRKLADLAWDLQRYREAQEHYRRLEPSPDVRDRLRHLDYLTGSRLEAGWEDFSTSIRFRHTRWEAGTRGHPEDTRQYRFWVGRSRFREEGVGRVWATDVGLRVTGRPYRDWMAEGMLALRNDSTGRAYLEGYLQLREPRVGGPVTASLTLGHAPILTDVGSILQGIRSTYAEGSLYGEPLPRVGLGGRVRVGWYTDKNRELVLSGYVNTLLWDAPLVTLGYEYAATRFKHTDTAERVYPYFNPRIYEMHAAVLVVSKPRSGTFWYEAQNVLSYAVQDASWLDTLFLRLEALLGKRHGVSLALFKTYTLRGRREAFYSEEGARIRYRFRWP